MRTTYFRLLALLAVLTYSIDGTCAPESCTLPNCPEGCTGAGGGGGSGGRPGGEHMIVRTFLKSKSYTNLSKSSRKPKRFVEDCINPLLPIIIDRQDIETLMAHGAITNRRYTDSSIVNIDVGVAGEDTQYWSLPELDFIASYSMESVDTASSVWSSEFPTSNYLFKGMLPNNVDTIFTYMEVNDTTVAKNGQVLEDETTVEILDWYSTAAFLPIECGWIIEETVTTIYPFNPDIDSTVEVKLFTVQATGYLTPINEEPVEAMLGFEEYTNTTYKDGLVVEYGEYEAFKWFSVKGHHINAFLLPGAPLEGVTQVYLITYDINIPACPPIQDIGVDPGSGIYAAQDTFKSGATLLSGPIQFVAGQEIDLKNGFSASNELNLLIDPDPCNL